jgi:hypothetical protein
MEMLSSQQQVPLGALLKNFRAILRGKLFGARLARALLEGAGQEPFPLLRADNDRRLEPKEEAALALAQLVHDVVPGTIESIVHAISIEELSTYESGLIMKVMFTFEGCSDATLKSAAVRFAIRAR